MHLEATSLEKVHSTAPIGKVPAGRKTSPRVETVSTVLGRVTHLVEKTHLGTRLAGTSILLSNSILINSKPPQPKPDLPKPKNVN